MRPHKFVLYLRVSTDKQGRSGLGLDAQKSAALQFLESHHGTLVSEFVEVESGKKSDRVELQRALAACRIHGAVLLVAKLDRLSRDAHFLLGLKESRIDFVCCDMPSANRLTVGILAMVAEEEARLISVRTKSALEAARQRGTKLGTPRNLNATGRARGAAVSAKNRSRKAEVRAQDLQPVLAELAALGTVSLGGIAKALNMRGVPSPRGKEWHRGTVSRLLQRLQAAA